MAEEQPATLAGGDGTEGEAQVLDIDPAQLAALLAQSADGTAQLIDEHGNTITLTAEQLAEAGIDLQNLEGAQVVQLAEGQQYVQGEDGQIYILEGGDAALAAAVAEGYVDASSLSGAVASSGHITDETEHNLGKSQLEHRFSSASDASVTPRISGFSATSPAPKQLQVPAPIMAAPKPIPTMVQHQQQSVATASRSLLAGDHDQQFGTRRDRSDHLQSPSKSQYARRPLSDQYQQQQVNNIPSERYASQSSMGGTVGWQGSTGAGSKQYSNSARIPVNEQEGAEELIFIQHDDASLSRGGQAHAATNRARSHQTAQMARRGGNFQSGLLPFQCDQCPRRFAHDHHLKRHQEMAHAKKRPFHCRYCNRDLYLTSDLHFQGHLRMQHKQELDYETNYGLAGARLGQTGGQQQLQLRTASTRPPGASPTQLGADGIGDEQEDEPDWDTLDAEKQRESQQVEEQPKKQVELDVAPTEQETPAADGETCTTAAVPEEPEAGGKRKCAICDQEFASSDELSKHEQEEHRMDDQSAAEPEAEKTKSPPALKAASTPHVCGVCQKQFGKQEYLDKHKIAHTDQQPFPCQYCPRRFKWKENLIRHINWHMERMPFKCALCPKGFPTQTRLDVHVKAKHMPKQREHVCPICSKAFYEKEYLAKHMRIHGSKIYPCTECDKKFIDEKFLRRHMMSHTQSRDFACDVCGKTFVKAAHLKSHRTIHTGERPYKCSKCHMAFGFKHNLRAHEKSEHGPEAAERMHVCEHCGRAFLQKNNLEVHLRIHRGVKPFQCSSCLKQFSRLEHLRAHVNAHAGIRDHQCTVCEKYFSSQSNLRQHLLVHQEESERAYHCGSCPKKFKQRQHLAKHVKTHTKNTDVQYVVIWEKGGTLLEATIITDGVAQDATGESHAAAAGGAESAASMAHDKAVNSGASADGLMEIDGQPATVGHITIQEARSIASNAIPYSHQATTLQVSDAEAAKLLAAAASGNQQVLDLSQVQLVDEDGNPIEGLSADQLLILQDGTIATTGSDGTTTAIAASTADSSPAVLDPSALLALAAEAQGEDGTIYISEENLQALAQQGVVFSYEEAAQ